MAEIEHFVKPDMKQHPRFSNIAHRKARLFPADNQVGDGRVVTDLTFGDAVATGVIDNETLAYFIARVEMFLQRVGIDAERLRFRQHLPTEMAHYATDCWDAEIQTSYGYVQHIRITCMYARMKGWEDTHAWSFVPLGWPVTCIQLSTAQRGSFLPTSSQHGRSSLSCIKGTSATPRAPPFLLLFSNSHILRPHRPFCIPLCIPQVD